MDSASEWKSMPMPKVSVLVPTFNRAAYVVESLKSILAQSYTDFEVIVIDDCSTDDTPYQIMALDDVRIRYIRNSENIGLARNYSKALEFSTGEYIQFFSDDDIMNPECLMENTRAMEYYPSVGLVHSDINIIDAKGIIVSTSHWAVNIWKKWEQVHSRSRKFRKEEYHRYLYRIYNTICLPTVMIRRILLEKVGYMNHQLVMLIDLDYWLKCTLFADVYFVNRKLVNFRIHPQSTTSRTSTDALLSEEMTIIKFSLSHNFRTRMLVQNSYLHDIMYDSRFYTHYNYLRLAYSIVRRLIFRSAPHRTVA